MAGSWVLFELSTRRPLLFCEESGAVIEESSTDDGVCCLKVGLSVRDICGTVEDLALALDARRAP